MAHYRDLEEWHNATRNDSNGELQKKLSSRFLSATGGNKDELRARLKGFDHLAAKPLVDDAKSGKKPTYPTIQHLHQMLNAQTKSDSNTKITFSRDQSTDEVKSVKIGTSRWISLGKLSGHPRERAVLMMILAKLRNPD